MSERPLAPDQIEEPLTAFLDRLMEAGGPTGEDFRRLEKAFREGEAQFTGELASMLKPAFKLSSLQGFVARHPYGYHGDFSVIEKIYARRVSASCQVQNWDLFFQSQPACEAVGNRRDFLISWMERHLFDDGSLVSRDILSVACGPCREVMDFVERHPDDAFRFTCLDQDANAIAFSSALLFPWRDRVSFLQQSAFESIDGGPFDLIYSAGLIRRLWKKLRSGGRLLIGNFSPENPSRAYMEFGGWKLIHRTEDELMELMRRGTGGGGDITCASEPLGINLFAEAAKY